MKAEIILSFTVSILLGVSIIHLSNKVQVIENRQALILEEIKDLKKKERITSQDVDFVLRLVSGVNDGEL
jgi:hypothetical protein